MKKVGVLLFDLEGNFLQELDSVAECADLIDSDQSAVSRVISGERLTVNGFQVRRKFKGTFLGRIGDVTGHKDKTFIVGKYWKDRLICTYNSTTEAGELTGILQGQIYESLSTGYKCKGFVFKKLNDA